MKKILAIVALAMTAACGGSDGSDSASNPSPSLTCLDVPATLLAGIATGEEKDVGGLKLTDGKAVKAPGFSKVYFVAAHLRAPGLDGEDVGVWATNSLEAGGGLLMAVDGFAKQFTTWPDADKTSAGIKSTEDGVDEAMDCVG